MKRLITIILSLLAAVACNDTNVQNANNGASTRKGRQFVAKSDGMVHQVTSENVYTLGKHVTIMEMQFTSITDSIYKPYSIFAAEVDLKGGVTVLSTCVADSLESIKPTTDEKSLVAPMRDHLHAMQEKRPTSEVLCGVNADFYIMRKSNRVQGIMYKDGQCLKGTFDGGEPSIAFAIMKDGTARIITQDEYESQKDNIQEAVSGRMKLVENGEKTELTDKSVHPRTAVGISANRKKVYLLVVDGRRENYSAGVTLDRLATILIALGADEAINLDGGGSSTFLIRNPEADKGFETRNRPTDRRGDRAVPNGLAVVFNK